VTWFLILITALVAISVAVWWRFRSSSDLYEASAAVEVELYRTHKAMQLTFLKQEIRSDYAQLRRELRHELDDIEE
jgi:hypothetical protein